MVQGAPFTTTSKPDNRNIHIEVINTKLECKSIYMYMYDDDELPCPLADDFSHFLSFRVGFFLYIDMQYYVMLAQNKIIPSKIKINLVQYVVLIKIDIMVFPREFFTKNCFEFQMFK